MASAPESTAASYASPVPHARRNVKARPTGLSGWKAQFLQNCEERVKLHRGELIDSLRKRSATANDLVTDLVAIEQARARDGSQGGSPFKLHRSDGDEDDDDLTADERLELLLYLQATLYSSADEDDARALLESLESAEREEVASCIEWAEGYCGGEEGTLQPAEVMALLSPAAGRTRVCAIASASDASPGSRIGTLTTMHGPPDMDADTGDAMAGPPSHWHGARAGALQLGADAAAAMLDDHGPVSPPPPHLELLQSEVLCPLCRKRFLFVLETVLGCRCGLRLNTANGLTISHLQASLAESYAAHRAGGCPAEPVYEVRDYFGIDALWMLCERCEDLQVVL